MKDYSVGIITKNKIFDTCKFLFYEYGIEDTTYQMICDKAEINRGLIPYHFKSKYNIAQCIYDAFREEYESWISCIFPLSKYETCLQFCCSSLILYRLICSHPNFRRFYYDLKTTKQLEHASFEIQQQIIQKLMQSCKITLTSDEVTTLTCMFTNIEAGLISGVYNKIITEPCDAIVKKDMNFVLSALGFEQKTIHLLFDEALNLVSGYSVDMEASFQLIFKEP